MTKIPDKFGSDKHITSSIPEATMTLSEFANRIGVSPSAIQGNNGKKHHKYITRINGGYGKGNCFVTEVDYNLYMQDEELKKSLIAVCGLFTEYMNKELLITYSEMSRFVERHTKYTAKSVNQVMSSMDFGYNMALAITLTYKKFDKSKVVAFDKYYGWNRL